MPPESVAPASRLAKPAAWRLTVAPPPAPAAATEHAQLISRGLFAPAAPHAVGRGPLPGPADVAARWLMAGPNLHPQAGARVTVDRVDGPQRERHGSREVHQHAELHLILPVAQLTYEIVLGDERYEVDGPASVYVPAGLPHSARAMAGDGFLVAIALDA
jgi:hypothetical protein